MATKLCCMIRLSYFSKSLFRRRLNISSSGGNIIKRLKYGFSLAAFDWIPRHKLPSFGIRGEQVQVLTEPQQFYNELKTQALEAKQRIVLSSLYLGTGELEKQLVDSIYQSCVKAKQNNSKIKIQILVDYTRGSRGEINSRTMLLPLLRDFGDWVEVSLFHTPDLRGVKKALIPDRFNETIGLHHMKVYLFDDNLIISGANLSDSYFTNRQDRYVMFRGCRRMADFFRELVTVISSVSFQLQPNNEVALPPDLAHHPFKGSDQGKSYKKEVQRRMEEFFVTHCNSRDFDTHLLGLNDTNSDKNNSVESRTTKCDSSSTTSNPAGSDEHTLSTSSASGSTRTSSSAESSDIDTWVVPTIQMGTFGIRHDEQFTNALFRNVQAGSELCLATGYFNLTQHYMKVILEESKAAFNILLASPQVNGFYGAKGVAGSIPDAYTHIAKKFYQQVCDRCQERRISMKEYYHDNWTFHAKGLWYYLPGQPRPSLCLIGSPNFGYRSVFRDLEMQVAIVTQNASLQDQLHQEKEQLYQRSKEVTEETFKAPDRHVPVWVTFVTEYFIRTFF